MGLRSLPRIWMVVSEFRNAGNDTGSCPQARFLTSVVGNRSPAD